MRIIILFLLLTNLVSVTPTPSFAYGECSDYGPMAMLDILTDKCKCMSGYVFGTGMLGKPYCVSGDSVCSEKYGYHSNYDSISGSCECSYGYIFGKDSIGRTQCVSPDSICTDKLGYNARYNTLSDSCECSSGYIISGGECKNGNSVCRTKHGSYSSYSSYDKTCECDSGYTFDDSNQCVEKQNNVYFILKELDVDNKKAIIRSEYDSGYYLITYGSGCYNSSFTKYLRKQIVVNLGTDYDLDTWDKIVLQNDNETCDIRSRERADSSTTLVEETDDYYSAQAVNYNYKPAANPVPIKPQGQSVEPKAVQKEAVINNKKNSIITATTTTIQATTTPIIFRIQATTTQTALIKEMSFNEKMKKFLRELWFFN